MTHIIKKPHIAVLGEFDGTLYHGNIWRRQGHQAEAVRMDGSVMHSDIIAFLNGYGTKSGQDLNTLITANKPSGLGDLTCGIDNNNKFFLKSSAATGWGLSSETASRAMFGYDGTETVQAYSDHTGSHYRLTANGRWHRGVFQINKNAGGLKIETPGTPTTVYVSIMLDGTPITDDPSFPGKTLAQFDFSNSLASDYDDLEVGGFMVGSNEQGDGANTFEILDFKYNTAFPFNITHIVFNDPNDNLSGSMDFTYQFNFTGTNQGYQGTITNMSIQTTINYTEGQAILFQPGPSWQFQNGVPAGFENHSSTTPYNWTGDEYSSLLRIGGTLTAPDGTQYAIIRKSGNDLGGHPITTLTASEINSYKNSGGTWSYTNEGISGVTDIVPDNRRVQNLITWIRVRGSENDADDIYNNRCLEDFEHSNIVNLTWVLEADGRVSMNFAGIYSGAYWPLDLGNITTQGKALLLRLGFAGEEPTVSTTHPSLKQVRATHRAPCVLATGRGYVDFRREVQGRDDHSIMADGSIVSGGLVPIRGWALTLRVKGPAHGYSADQERHLRSWWSYARRGLTIYPSFGDGDNLDKGGNDTRRHIDKTKLQFETSAVSSGAHNVSQTSEADESANHHGKRVGGRILVRRHPSDQQARRESYLEDLDLHQDIRLRVLDDPSR